jgi:hypothetical protein
METTQVADSKTVAEVQHYLATHGATSVQVEYGPGGTVDGLAFRINVAGDSVPFRLPCRWKAVEAVLRKSSRRPRSGDTYEQWARRVAWRQIKRWVEAQMAMVETGMVKTEEVFLPYAIVRSNGGMQTMFEYVEEKKILALPAPEGS